MAQQPPAQRPLPEPTLDDAPFWEGLKERRLLLQRCKACGAWRGLPAAPICPRCLSQDYAWEAVSGRGRLYTWTVVYQRYHPAFVQEIPYNVALVELEEGPRLIARIVGCKNEDLRPNMPLEVGFEQVSPDFVLYHFRPVQG